MTSQMYFSCVTLCPWHWYFRVQYCASPSPVGIIASGTMCEQVWMVEPQEGSTVQVS